ncbi:lipoyl protein ligase domain-containing protein [Jonesia quinghaiensis]|uniref:lipoyl protein ligase domain-containing protein n=1 Tax=Jonesia quinghaiensis TaxID=262806 RepID=UPI0004044921|nr:lipoate--protein ligase [Jonesia quinghaiensis]
MRAEYKVPGGKLVAVDLDVIDGHLANVRIHGDFFLEPDDALEDFDQALTGMPQNASFTEMREAVESALKPGVTMMGFSPRDIVVVVRRALGYATTWDDHTFDIIHDTPELPHMQIALDQAQTEAVEQGLRGPMLRIWEWGGNAVIIGSFQSYRNEVDEDAAHRHDVTVVRRISGGGAMFVEPGNTITYSLIVPGSLVDGMSFEESYKFLDQWVIDALADVGINARYVPLNDIASEHGKIAGAAQKRLAGGTVLHHVTMSYNIDADKMLEVLRIGREKLSDKGTKSAKKRVDPLRSQTGMTREDIIEAFKAHFRSRYATQDSVVSDWERNRAKELIDTKFGTEEWLKRVP